MTQLNYGFLALSTWMLATLPTVLAAEEAEDDELTEVRLLSTPSSSASIGAAYNGKDITQLGRYNGRTDQGIYPLLNVDINRRDDESGIWTRVDGRNLGFSNRWLRYERNRQGDWHYVIEFDQLESASPYLVDADLTGVGRARQASGGTVNDLHLAQQRDNVKLAMGKRWNDSLALNLSYRHERKKGERNWNTGGRTVGTAFQSFFIVEPIDYRTQELGATLDYSDDSLQLRGGYLLSLFENATEKLELDVSSIDASAQSIDTSTAPDNHSQLVYLDGGYRLSESTRTTFKLSFQQDRQDESFYQSNPFNNRSDLGGRVDTARVNVALASRLNSQLSLNAKLRYEDRDDHTPQLRYIAGLGQTNEVASRTNTNTSLDANYRLQHGTTLSGGLEYDQRKRDPLVDPNSARRTENSDTTLHIGGRKQLSETLRGTVRLSHSVRGGSEWLSGSGVEDGTLLSGAVAKDYVNSLQYADRTRDQLRLTLDWYPAEEWSLQWHVEASNERYSGLPLGPKDGDRILASVDAAYQLSDEWALNGWLSANRRSLDSKSRGWSDLNSNNLASAYNDSLQTWSGDSVDRGYALGFGVKGTPSDELKLGGALQYSKDSSRFTMNAITAPADADYAPAATLPSIEYRLLQLKLYGEYALDEQSGLRLDYRYDRYTNSDWSWSAEADYTGTNISQQDNESNHYIGISYFYRGW